MTPTLLPDVPVNEEGYLIEPDHWSEEVARRLAAQESIRLTDRHWDVIRFMRAWYAEHGVAHLALDDRAEAVAVAAHGLVLAEEDLELDHGLGVHLVADRVVVEAARSR